jgi:GT2 family glycosyltransferase
MYPCDVVIVNFNAGLFLKDAVATALQSRAVSRVFVVDNASIDGSLDLLPSEPRLFVIRNTANVGFAAGCNIGLARTTAEYVLLLNPDCYVLENAIDQLVETLRCSEGAAMVGPLLLNTDGSEQAGGRCAAPTLLRSFVRAFGLKQLNRWLPPALFDFLSPRGPLPKMPTEVESVSGACMLVRRDAMGAVGTLDDGYFLYCEDVDWCRRFRQQAWTILFVPDARVVHHKGVSSRQTPFAAEWHKHRGMVRFYCKFLRENHPVPVSILVLTGIWIRFTSVSVRLSARAFTTSAASTALRVASLV